jgi:hypothetical protein
MQVNSARCPNDPCLTSGGVDWMSLPGQCLDNLNREVPKRAVRAPGTAFALLRPYAWDMHQRARR